ncbi:guanylate kinase [bacterium]|nr:guanylate kinase [bacterium]
MKQPSKAQMIILSAPSGAGKSSFIERVLKEFPQIKDTVTYTTRSMRSGESDGNPYYFVSKERFRQLIDEGFFVEYAQVHENFYGTPLHQIEDAKREGKVLIMDVDVKGAATFKKKFPSAVSIFILPPSMEELKKRIMGRDKKLPEDLEIRLINAQMEVSLAHTFDFRVTNDHFEESYAQFKKIIEDLL